MYGQCAGSKYTGWLKIKYPTGQYAGFDFKSSWSCWRKLKKFSLWEIEERRNQAACSSWQSETVVRSWVHQTETSRTTGDVTRSANSLHDRADELMMSGIITHVDNSLSPLNTSFLSSTAVDRDTGNLIGSIIETGLSYALFAGI